MNYAIRRLLERGAALELYRELGPSYWYLTGRGVWEDIKRFKLFGG